MTKAQQMLAMAGLPDTAEGRAAFHKIFPTPEDFFKLFGLAGTDGPIKPENVVLKHYPGSQVSYDTSTEEYKEGGSIHIAPSKRGTFTAAATKHGKSVQGFASQVLANKGNYSPAMVKKANFARNAAKWKHEDGGPVMYADGSVIGGEDDFTPTKEYYKGWYQSPMYKSIIANQAKTLYPDNEKKQAKYINNWNNTPNDEYWNTYQNPTLGDYDISAFGFSAPLGNIYLQRKFVKENPSLANALFTHEIKHRLPYTTVDEDIIIKNTPKFNPNIHKGGSKYNKEGILEDHSKELSAEDNYYDKTEPDEVMTEIHAIRQLAKQAGVYNPYTEPFKKEYMDKINTLFNEGGPEGKNFNQLQRLKLYYSDDQIMDMMNTISQNKTNSGDNVQIAALGSFVGGPPEDEYSYRIGGNPTSAPYDRFPKKDPGFGYRGPGSFSYYRDRLDNRNVQFATPHQGVKDAIIDTNTITGSCESGTCYQFEDGGLVDVYKLMGMPTPSMYGYGSQVSNYTPSYMFGGVQSANNTYRHGYANGGPIGMYKTGGFMGGLEDVGKMTLNNMAAPLEQISGNNFVNFDYNNKWAADSAAVMEGAIGAGTDILGTTLAGPAYGMGKQAIQGYTKNLGHSTETQKGADKWANQTGQILGSSGDLIAGIASGNPQQIVGGASNILGTAGGQLGSKELATVGQLGGIASQFVGTGGSNNQGSLFKTPTSVTPNSTNFGTGTAGGNLSNYGIGFAAMGGAVNAPNMMRYANGGMTPPPIDESMAGAPQGNGSTQINVERGELLVNKDGKILTEYRGGGMVPHPADGGMDERGTVPAQEGQFVITKKLAPNYKSAMKNNDELYAAAMRNNIAFDKQRKEAKEKEQQAMAQQMMTAKFGGMVRGYGYGGGIRKFDGGGGLYDNNSIIPPMQGQALPASISPSGYPTYVDPNGGEDYTYSNIPGKGWVTYKAGSNKAIPLYGNPAYNSSVDLLNKTYLGYGSSNPPSGPPSSPPNNNFNNNRYAYSVPPPIDESMAGSSAYQAETGNIQGFNDMGAQQKIIALNAANRVSGTDYSNYVPTSDVSNPNTSNNNNKLLSGLGYGLEYGSALYNLGRGIFEKADKVNPQDYMIKNRIKPYEERYRPDYRPYNAMMYSMNRNPNSDSLAGKVNLYNTAQNAYADERYKVNQANLSRRMQADQANATIDQFNANAKWQGDIWNKQALAKKRDFIGKGFEQGSLAYQNERNAFLYGQSLKDLTANYDYVNGRWVPKKTNG